MLLTVPAMWLPFITLIQNYKLLLDGTFDVSLTLTLRLLHCKHPDRDFRCERRPGGNVAMSITSRYCKSMVDPERNLL